jgi:hypothetical protein
VTTEIRIPAVIGRAQAYGRRGAGRLAIMEQRQRVRIEGRQLTVSNLDKVLFPDVGFTKAQVIDYCRTCPGVPSPSPAGPTASTARPSSRRTPPATRRTGCAG